MVRRNNFGDEIFECPRCLNEVEEFDEYCGVCGDFLGENIDYSNKENKHKAISYSIGEFHYQEVLIATLNNSSRGILKFIVPIDSQIAMRVKYYIRNNNSDFLENGLMQDKLIEYENFVVLELQNEEYYIDTKLFEEEYITLDSNTDSKKNFFDKIKQRKIENIFDYEEDWIDIKCSIEYKNALKECVSYIRPETFFYYLFRLIVLYDFEKKNKVIPSKEVLLGLFEEAARKILKESCSFLINKNDNPHEELVLSFNWENHHVNYSKLVDPLRNSTLDFINYSKNIQETLEIDSDNPFNTQESLIFFQKIMFMGSRIAYTRIVNELNNKSFLGGEIIKNHNYSELIIYLTPEGFLNLSKIFKMSLEERTEIFNSFLNENKISKIESGTLRKTLETSILLEYKKSIYKHFLQFPNYINDFMSERINKKPLSSILVESQANFKEVKL